MTKPVQYWYRGAKRPPSNLEVEIEKAARQVHASLSELDLGALGISEYNQRYLSQKLSKPEFEFSLITAIFGQFSSLLSSDRGDLTLVDYGAGSGIIGLVAKALGIGQVIYCDIYDVSANDAAQLGESLGLLAEEYFVGDSTDLVGLLKERSIVPDILLSNDCLEHIYDMESFMKDVSQMVDSNTGLWLSSAANPHRPKTHRVLSNVARIAEFEGTPDKAGRKQRDTNRAFVDVRREMILEAAPEINTSDLDELVARTRGKRQDDILQCVQAFQTASELPDPPEHPTNTCDPTNGNWAERLMDPFWLCGLCRENGVDACVRPGYWSPDPRNALKDFAKTANNVLIRMFGDKAMRLAPYYVIFKNGQVAHR